MGDDVAFSYAEFRAASFGDPRLRELTELGPRIAQLDALAADHDHQQARLARTVTTARDRAARLDTTQARLQTAIDRRVDTRAERFTATIAAATYTDRAAAGKALAGHAGDHLVAHRHRPLGTYRAEMGAVAGPIILVETPGADSDQVAIRLDVGAGPWPAWHPDDLAGADPSKLIARLERAARHLDDDLAAIRTEQARVLDDLHRAEQLLGVPFADAADLARLRTRQAVLVRELQAEATETAEPGPTPPSPELAGVSGEPDLGL